MAGVHQLRCAIYTRKSSEEGLEQDFNSLHAQREACAAYIASQKHEGWKLIPTAYDDGGISGGTMERPAIQQLLADIKNRRIDVVVVYKVDRLTRSLADFARMVELFDAHNVSFVSVTQQFNTTSSMGRLTLNVLLSFAQFEREVTGERIRDKIAASKQKGMWMGGQVPLGYEVKDRKLLIKKDDADTLNSIFRKYLDSACVRLLQKELIRCGIRSRKGHILSRGALYKMLSNPLCIGHVRHKDVCYPGQHKAIIDQALWDQVQQKISDNRIGNKKIHTRKIQSGILAGKLFDVSGERLVTVHANKKGKRYRYYISQSLAHGTKDAATGGWRLPGQEIDRVVIQATASIIHDRDGIITALSEAEIKAHEWKRIIKTLNEADETIIAEKFLQRVELHPDGICLTVLLDTIAQAVDGTPLTITRNIPMQMKRRGIEMRMIVSDTKPVRTDPTLIRTIIKAHRWLNELVSGKAISITDIAKRESTDRSYVNRVLPLAFLSPEITESILAGTQPADLNVEKLTKRIDLPLEWEKQHQLLGFTS
jgi:DNA invertase Pin-like site-specific DNA recombinase